MVLLLLVLLVLAFVNFLGNVVETPEWDRKNLKRIHKFCLNKIVKTQRNSTQSKTTNVGVRHSSHVFHPPTPPPNTNFPATSRPARELKFGTDTH